MKNYIEFEKLNDKCDFAKLIFTTSKVDMASKDDRKKVCEEVGFNFERLTNNKQIHSGIVNIISEEDVKVIKDGDALITNIKDTPLITFVADCVPIAFLDPKNKAIGLAHAGWRGTYAKIAMKTIDMMIEQYNTNPEDLVCVIGPSIGCCCYEVSEELIEKFNTIITKEDENYYIIKEGKYYLDLWKINEYILKQSKVKDENIIKSNLCTSCNSDNLHSYRKHNQTSKRLGMILQIK